MLLGFSLFPWLSQFWYPIQHIVAAHTHQRKGVLDEQKDGQKNVVPIQTVFYHHFGLRVSPGQFLDLLASHLAVAQFRIDPEGVLRCYPGSTPANQAYQPCILVSVHPSSPAPHQDASADSGILHLGTV